MSSVYIAQGLNSILKTWEDFNLIRETMFHANKFPGITESDSDFLVPVIGSELNKYGTLARSIPDYQLLRDVLAGSSFIHPTNFLPKVPKDQRGRYSAEEYYRSTQIFPSVMIPKFLLKWNDTKRGLIIEDTVPIPLVDLREENWLEHLPYHSFYLRVNSPIVFKFKNPPDFTEKEWSVRDFLVYEDNEIVNVLAWATENEDIHLTPRDQKDLETLTKCFKQGKFKTIKDFFDAQEKLKASTGVTGFFITAGIRKGSTMIKVFDFNHNVMDQNLYDIPLLFADDKDVLLGNSAETIRQTFVKARIVFELLNGLCKLICHLPKSKSIVSIEPVPAPQLPKYDKKWFELNAQTINHLETDTEGGLIIIKRSIGAEKSPHIRRAHFRRIVQANGTVKNIWIEETTIRKDKLQTEELQGGVLRVT